MSRLRRRREGQQWKGKRGLRLLKTTTVKKKMMMSTDPIFRPDRAIRVNRRVLLYRRCKIYNFEKVSQLELPDILALMSNKRDSNPI